MSVTFGGGNILSSGLASAKLLALKALNKGSIDLALISCAQKNGNVADDIMMLLGEKPSEKAINEAFAQAALTSHTINATTIASKCGLKMIAPEAITQLLFNDATYRSISDKAGAVMTILVNSTTFFTERHISNALQDVLTIKPKDAKDLDVSNVCIALRGVLVASGNRLFLETFVNTIIEKATCVKVIADALNGLPKGSPEPSATALVSALKRAIVARDLLLIRALVETYNADPSAVTLKEDIRRANKATIQYFCSNKIPNARRPQIDMEILLRSVGHPDIASCCKARHLHLILAGMPESQVDIAAEACANTLVASEIDFPDGRSPYLSDDMYEENRIIIQDVIDAVKKGVSARVRKRLLEIAIEKNYGSFLRSLVEAGINPKEEGGTDLFRKASKVSFHIFEDLYFLDAKVKPLILKTDGDMYANAATIRNAHSREENGVKIIRKLNNNDDIDLAGDNMHLAFKNALDNIANDWIYDELVNACSCTVQRHEKEKDHDELEGSYKKDRAKFDLEIKTAKENYVILKREKDLKEDNLRKKEREEREEAYRKRGSWT